MLLLARTAGAALPALLLCLLCLPVLVEMTDLIMAVWIGAKEMLWTVVRAMLVDAAPFVASADGRALGIAELVGQSLCAHPLLRITT